MGHQRMILIVALTSSVFGMSTSAHLQNADAWRTSWDAYIDALNECGQSTVCKMKFRDELVKWEGVIEALGSTGSSRQFEAGQFYDGTTPRVVLRMNPRKLTLGSGLETKPIEKLYLDVKQGSLDRWKKLVGKSTRFCLELGGGLMPYGFDVAMQCGDSEPVDTNAISAACRP